MAKKRKYTSDAAICPWYKSEEKQIIYCEGFVEDSVVHQAFSHPQAKADYSERFCEGDYAKCCIAAQHEREFNDD